MRKRISTDLFKELFQPISKSPVSRKYREILDLYSFALYATKFLTNQSTYALIRDLPREQQKKIRGMYQKLLEWDFETFYDEKSYGDSDEDDDLPTPWD